MKIEILKSIEINKPLDEVYAVLSDVNQWNNWSPWACLESNVKMTYAKDEKTGYTTLKWDGKLIGAGDMIVVSKTPTRIDYKLVFHRPYQSKSDVWFEFKDLGSKTLVSWGMISHLPFFMFFLKKMMMAYIGSDYVRGLARLKEYMETGSVLCNMSEVENADQNSFYLVGKRDKTDLEGLAPSMNNIFDGAMKDIEQRKLPIPDGFISFYHEFDLVKATTDFTCGVFYYQKPTVPTEYIVTEVPQHKNLKMTLKGTYNHLPTAWSKIWCYQRGNKIKINKKVGFYELYLNSPKMVAPKDILTELRIPIK